MDSFRLSDPSGIGPVLLLPSPSKLSNSGPSGTIHGSGRRKLFETLHVGDQRLQIIRRKIDGWHAAGLHFRCEMFEKFG